MDNQSPADLAASVTALELWEQGSTALRSQLWEATWKTWFDSVRPGVFDGKVLTLSVPNALARKRIISSYEGLLRDLLQESSGISVELDIMVETEARDEGTVTPGSGDDSGSAIPSRAGKASSNPSGGRLKAGDSFNPRYRFEDFVTGASNRFAHAAAMSVAESPARSYNPLFIYGQAGLGKTHLLHAIGHYIKEYYPAQHVRYVSTETFMNEFVDAIRNNAQGAFKRNYREVNVLLIDDIQFMENKESLQEEFFYTFNSLHSAHSQIVISSDRPPRAIATLEDRLRSRFEWGLITDIHPPELETRLAILQKRRESENFTAVPDEVLAFIATHISDNVRELEGALIRVAAYASLNNTPLSEELAHEVLADLLPPSQPRVITPELILNETSSMFGWSVEELCGKSRRRPLVTARQIGMYVFRELTDYSYPHIAREFGGRDHTTVMHAVDKISKQMAEKRVIFDQVSELISRLKHGGKS